MSSLGIKITVDNKELLEKFKESKEQSLQLEDSMQALGKSMSTAFNSPISKTLQLIDQIRGQKTLIVELETQCKSAQIEFDEINLTSTDSSLIEKRKEASLLFNEVSLELNVEKKRLTELEKELGNLSIAYALAHDEKKKLSTENSQLKGIISGLDGLQASLAAAEGTMVLFGIESKNLEDIQTKLHTAISITNSLSDVSQTLNQNSAFKVNTVAKATQVWDGAVKVLNTQLGISTKLSKAFVAGGIGLIIAGIIQAISYYKSWKKEQEEILVFNKEVSKSVQDEVTHLSSLERILQDPNKSLHDKKIALKELKTIIPEYNAMLSNEGTLINENTQALEKYIQQIKNSAKAKIAAENASKAEQNFQDWINGLSDRDQLTLVMGDSNALEFGRRGAYEALDSQRGKLLNEVNKWNKILDDTKIDSIKISNTSNSAESTNKPNTEKNLKEREALYEKLQQQQDAWELDLKQRQINHMKDGSDKELAQLRLNFDKREKELIQQGEKYLKNQQDFERKTWEVKNPDWEKQKLKFTPETATISQLSEETKNVLADLHKENNEAYEKAQNEIQNKLLAKYKENSDKRKEIEEKFNTDIELLRRKRELAIQEGDSAVIEQIDKAIAKATKDKGTAIITFDFEVLKENPEYVQALQDIKNTSSETLEALLAQLQNLKVSTTDVLDPAKLTEYTTALQNIINELSRRDPFKALITSQQQLAQSQSTLAEAKNKLDRVMSGADKTMTQADATKKYNEALDGVSRSSAKAAQAQKAVQALMEGLYTSIKGVGTAIGGTTGEIINYIADIGSFANKTIDGIQSVARTGATALSTIEKASVILGIISTAIQIMQKLNTLFPDSYQKYEKYAAKIREINKMRDAVNEYELAVIKAKDAEENWFAKDKLQSLRQAYGENSEILKQYNEKLYEDQAQYQNKSGGGWFTKSLKWVAAGLANSKFGPLGAAATLIGINKKENKELGTVSAIDNLRIETRKAKKGFLGSGIGGKSQKTEDLREWIKKNEDLNKHGELFDEKGMINTELGTAILEKFGDKLVGDTKATLETLIEMKKQYDEYKQQLSEYVSSLYAPLVDNFVDSLWAWLDEGKNALDSFREHASQTFRAIASDILRSLIIKNVLNGYDKDILDLYDKYSSGELTEEQLIKAVSERTGTLITSFDEQLPVLQNVLHVINGSLEGIGINLQEKKDQSAQTSAKGIQAVTQDTASELVAQARAMRLDFAQAAGFEAAKEPKINSINDEVKLIQTHTFDIKGLVQNQLNSLIQIERNTLRTANGISEIVNSGVKIREGA